MKVSVATSVLHCGKANKPLLVEVYAEWIHRGHSHIQTTIKLQPWQVEFCEMMGQSNLLPRTLTINAQRVLDIPGYNHSLSCRHLLWLHQPMQLLRKQASTVAENKLTWFTRKMPLPREDATGLTIHTPPHFLKAAVKYD